MRSVSKIEADLQKIEDQKVELKEKQGALQRELVEAKEAEDQKVVEAFWTEALSLVEPVSVEAATAEIKAKGVN